MFPMTLSRVLRVHIDNETKSQARKILANMGLSISDVVRIFLKRVINDRAFPFEPDAPNRETRAAMRAARRMMRSR